MNPPELLASPDRLREAFVAGLERQLAEPGLGTFILVLANAGFDPAIWPLLKDRLAHRFAELADEVGEGLRSGRRLNYPDDDLMVFLKLMAMGFDAIGATEWRPAGPWEVQFNPLRALRPARASGLATPGVLPPAFNPQGFHFNKPFLRPEILWEGNLQRRDARLLYNKFPFAPLHGLLVPEPDRERPQMLAQEAHHYAWHLAENLGPGLPGLGIAYNSYGAHASVNHLHFQVFVRDRPLPVQAAGWRHNGGGEDYPSPCRVFASALDGWFFIEELHRAGTAYNLLYLPGRVYCLPRRRQGGAAPPAWSAGHAWYEMAGGVTAFNRDDFSALNADDLAAELSRQSPVHP